ncbi:MAG: response regulator [PVC group bacterium]|nr:response regulator [PVC group bacterium]
MSVERKIVVVDDEEDFCFFVKKNLEATGNFRVLLAHNGEDGIRLTRLEMPDVVLLDVMMPNLGGPDVADILNSDPKTKDIPVIFLTAIVTKQEIGVEPMKAIGGLNYIAKPVEIAQLVEAINKVISK